jgi:hypothetical protein
MTSKETTDVLDKVEAYVARADERYAEAIASLSKADTERGHKSADAILCEMLTELGYTKTVAAFEALDKWYA